DEDDDALEKRRPQEAPRALLHELELELRAALERDEREGERVDAREPLDRVVIDEAQDVRSGDDPREQIAGEVRHPEHLDELAHERPGEEQKAHRRDRRRAVVDVLEDAGRAEEQASDDHEEDGLEHAPAEGLGPLLHAPSRASSSEPSALGSATSPTCARTRRSIAGATNSPKIAVNALAT